MSCSLIGHDHLSQRKESLSKVQMDLRKVIYRGNKGYWKNRNPYKPLDDPNIDISFASLNQIAWMGHVQLNFVPMLNQPSNQRNKKYQHGRQQKERELGRSQKVRDCFLLHREDCRREGNGRHNLS